MKSKNFIIIAIVFVLCLLGSFRGDVFSQDSEVLDGEELPPRTQISILDVLYPEFTIDEKNVKILTKIVSGDTKILRTINYEDYVDLLDLMSEYRWYLLKNFTPNNKLSIEQREDITIYSIFGVSYDNAFVSFCYALYNNNPEIVINAYIHFNKLSFLISPDNIYIPYIKAVFYANLDDIKNQKIKALHTKAIMVLERLDFLQALRLRPELLSIINKNKFRLIYSRIDEEDGIPPFHRLGEADLDFLFYGLENQYLSVVYACVRKLKEIYNSTDKTLTKEEIKTKIIALEKKFEEFDLFLGEIIYEIASNF